jgi:hypothetical protein
MIEEAEKNKAPQGAIRESKRPKEQLAYKPERNPLRRVCGSILG